MRTPFYIGQPIDQVLYVIKRTGRSRLGIRVKAKEGDFTFNTKKRSDKLVQSDIASLSIDLKQNLSVWYYLSDCTLQFKKKKLQNGKLGPYSIVNIDKPFSGDITTSCLLTCDK